MKIQLPACVKAVRIGHWSMGSENEYDAMGEQAPVTWVCNCGHTLLLDHFDYNTEQWIITPENRKFEFLAAHPACIAKCFKCGIVVVDERGAWCDACSTKNAEDHYSSFGIVADDNGEDDYIPF